MSTASPHTRTSATAPPASSRRHDSSEAISLTGLRKTFGRGEHTVVAVDRIDLTVGRGEIVALLGPNGAGKTTTLDMLLGLTEPTAGTVSVYGEKPARASASGNIAAVLQTGGLLADLSVRETLDVIASLHGRAALSRVPEILDRTGLDALARRRISKCSGGEQQRVKFALALIPDPDTLVLDEPTAGMDVTARRHFWDVMRADADAGRTIIFATHYLEEAEQFARRTVVMHHGRIVADAPTAQLRSGLGARTLTVTLPATGAAELVNELETTPGITDLHRDAQRLSLRSTGSDATAQRLLAAGAYDLEIVAPTLETAFTTLTKDQS
ncbi:ABC transporter ATP-binding protein [Microbacterium sp. YY-01]|uniref:ABC transporter ATP-binding protein n=1 Tax=Microbacterium sp. YY-01 TaxID=3421634 RepID=UPI003D1796D4